MHWLYQTVLEDLFLLYVSLQRSYFINVWFMHLWSMWDRIREFPFISLHCRFPSTLSTHAETEIRLIPLSAVLQRSVHPLGQRSRMLPIEHLEITQALPLHGFSALFKAQTLAQVTEHQCAHRSQGVPLASTSEVSVGVGPRISPNFSSWGQTESSDR